MGRHNVFCSVCGGFFNLYSWNPLSYSDGVNENSVNHGGGDIADYYEDVVMPWLSDTRVICENPDTAKCVNPPMTRRSPFANLILRVYISGLATENDVGFEVEASEDPNFPADLEGGTLDTYGIL